MRSRRLCVASTPVPPSPPAADRRAGTASPASGSRSRSRNVSASVPATSPVTKITRFASVRRGVGKRAIERLAVEPRHLQIADDQIERARAHACERLFAVAPRDRRCSRHRAARRRPPRPAPPRLPRPARARRRRRRPAAAGRAAAAPAAASPPVTGSSTKNDAPASRPRLERGCARRAPARSRRRRSGRARCPCRPPSS